MKLILEHPVNSAVEVQKKTTVIEFANYTSDHGGLGGLSDDDHPQYHNDTRGDARYFPQTVFLDSSTGSACADLPVKLDDDGHIDASMINDADVDHDNLTNTHNLTTDIDHDSLTNTHNLSTDIDHNGLTNTHNLTTDIDHNAILNNHNLTTDIDHNAITNTHNLTTDIDHNAITNNHNLSTDIDHDGLTNTHNLSTDIDHDSLTNTHNLTSDIDHDLISGLSAAGSAVSHGHINTGAQTLYGVKTFNAFPVTPSSAPTTNYQVANKKYVDDATGGGLTAVNIVVSGTAGENVSQLDMVYLEPSDYKWYKIDTDDPDKVGYPRGCVSESGGISADASGEIVLFGKISGFSGLTAGAHVYGSTTAGSYTQTKPTVSKGGSQVCQVIMGHAVSTTEIFIDPITPIRYIKRADLAQDGTLTIEHYADAAEQHRKVAAYISTTVSAYTADQCSGGTALCDDAYTGRPASAAFDDDDATWWSANNVTPDGTTEPYIGYDFGSGVTKTVKRYTVTSRPDNTQFPTAWKFQYSSDGSSWTDADTQTSQSFSTGGETKTYDVSGDHDYRYWRLLITAVTASGTYASVAELEMMEAQTPSNYDEPLSVSSWSLEDAKIACRFDDGSGSDATIYTTFKNLHTATLDVTCEVLLP